MEIIDIKGHERKDLGKSAAKRTRTEGLVPCVLYSGNTALHFSAHPLELRHIIYTGEFKQADIEINGEKHRCILKAMQFNPVTDVVTHVDFLKLVPGNSIKVEVPVKFLGIAQGVKEGGKLQQMLRKIKIKTTPEKVLSEMQLDITHLKLGQSVRVRDIKVEEGIEILNAPSIPVAIIEIPRALRGAKAAEKK